MGTPDFAVTILKHLVENNYKVVGVITAPDKPAGRGRKLNESAYKKIYQVFRGTIITAYKFKKYRLSS
jgi:methionyl-tRNA formyltransferase